MTNKKTIPKLLLENKLLILGLIIYLLFNLSALKTKWFDYFFFGSSIHYCCKGMDFYGIPNGVYSFIHGGNLSGSDLPKNLPPYSKDIVSNPNDYHPLTSLAVGTFLIQFSPEKAFNIWILIKIFITFLITAYIYKNFKDNKYIDFALFVFLANFSQYNEIRISQYQFLFNIFLLLLMVNLYKNKDNLEHAVLYFLTLISKPISLLIFPLLIVKRQYLTAVVGLLIFVISTFTFNVMGIGEHFTNNLVQHLANPRIPNSIDFMSLDALIRYTFNLQGESIKYFKYIILFFIYLLSLRKRTNINLSIFLLITYFLFFYDNLFQYHFSILGPVLAICLLTVKDFQTKFSKLLIFFVTMPNVFFILRRFNLQFIPDPVYGPNPTLTGWQIVSFFQFLPIMLLILVVIFPIIKAETSIIKHHEKNI